MVQERVPHRDPNPRRTKRQTDHDLRVLGQQNRDDEQLSDAPLLENVLSGDAVAESLTPALDARTRSMRLSGELISVAQDFCVDA